MDIAIITGASSGIGKWFALYAAKCRNHIDELWLLGRNEERLIKTGEKITKETGIPCRSISADLTRKEDLKNLELQLEKSDPRIYLLINCAGYGMIGKFKYVPLEESTGMVGLNCEALTGVTRLCLPYMPRESEIFNVSSAAAFLPQSGFAVYAATKSYVLSFSRAIAKELKPQGISVMAVCPGCVDTPFFDRAEKYKPMKAYKKFFMARPQDVVRKAFADADKKKRVSIYGGAINCLYWISKFMPDAVLRIFY